MKKFIIITCLLISSFAYSQTRPVPNEYYGDRGTGFFGDVGIGQFGNPSIGSFNKSKIVPLSDKEIQKYKMEHQPPYRSAINPIQKEPKKPKQSVSQLEKNKMHNSTDSIERITIYPQD